jgi:putative DNA primase/helicase
MDQVIGDSLGQAEVGMKTIDAARGRWREILPKFGIDASALNGKHHPCPCTNDGTDRFRFADREGSGSYFCACSDGASGGIALVMCKTGMGFADAAAAVDKIIGNGHDAPTSRPSYYSHRLRSGAGKISQSAYLTSRGLSVAPGLDWHRAVEYRHDDGSVTTHPAMLAPITRGGEFLTYHATYLDAGRKASVPEPRKILPGPGNRGGACALYPPAETMGIAEGVETAIAASMLHRGMPVWSALNAALLAGFDPPSECRHLMVFADHDRNYAGHAAAYTLAHRVAKAKAVESVTVLLPPNPGQDWNDVLMLGQRVAA